MKKTSCEQRGEAGERLFTCQVKSALLHTAVCCWSRLFSLLLCLFASCLSVKGHSVLSRKQKLCIAALYPHTSSVFHHGSVCMTQEGHFWLVYQTFSVAESKQLCQNRNQTKTICQCERVDSLSLKHFWTKSESATMQECSTLPRAFIHTRVEYLCVVFCKETVFYF